MSHLLASRGSALFGNVCACVWGIDPLSFEPESGNTFRVTARLMHVQQVAEQTLQGMSAMDSYQIPFG